MSMKIKTVTGIVTDGRRMEKRQIVVRFTSDKLGESLSLQAGDIMIHVAYEDILQIIKKARK